MATAARRRHNEKILRPVWPNAGLEAEFRRKLYDLIEEMNRSFSYWIKAAYRADPPVMALDVTPAVQIRIATNKLSRRWQKRFDVASKELAKYFTTAMNKRSDKVLMAILKKGGWTVRFQMTPAMKDIMKATIAEQVGLIRSIPQQYLVNVQSMVMQSVKVGRDLGPLAKEIEKQYGVTKRRAALIARDQNNKATASMIRARQVEVGIKKAVWLHSGGGKTPRKSHVANSGKTYSTDTGWYDPNEKKWIFPGELINCRCVSRSLIRGFS